MKTPKFAFLSVVFLFLTLSFCILADSKTESLYVSNLADQTKTIIIDAGHGGFDGGAQAEDGTQEKDINLLIANNLQNFLKLGGFDVIMTRTSDEGIEDDNTDTIAHRKVSDMKKRLKIINQNPDAIFVSIHLNKFTTSSAKGAQVFYSPNTIESKTLAECIQKSTVSLIQPENERIAKKGDKTIYLLKNSSIPSVIVECGFLSNKEDLTLLKDKEYQLKMAFSIYCGILEYFK